MFEWLNQILETWKAKKDSQYANAKYNEMLYYGLGNDDEDTK